MRAKRIDNTGEMTASQRHRARKRGVEVPIRKTGLPGRPFMDFVQKTLSCWLWTGSRDRKGYGKFSMDGFEWRAHRWSWRLVNGDIPQGMVIRHRCDVPSCVNPDHLEIGTHAQNMSDRAVRNRTARGEKSRSILKPEDVIAIRARYVPRPRVFTPGGNVMALAAEYGVSVDTIFKIINRQLWGHL